jgi:RNA polymerase sigma-32 factor
MISRNDSSRRGYIARVMGFAQLSREEEGELVAHWRKTGDLGARDTLIRSQMRTVVTIAGRYRGYAASMDDLISEGNFGLLHALSKFDPERGTRFITYAVYWVRAYILAHLARSRTLVSSGVHSKLLAKLKREASRAPHDDCVDTDALIAERLNISRERLHSLQERLDLRDVPLPEEAGEGVAQRSDALSAEALSGEDALLSNESHHHVRQAVSKALHALDERERFIVEYRLMAHQEDELSLAAIGRALGVSRERARQLEARAMRKIKKGLAGSRHWDFPRSSVAA